jgi:hypothetical protein
MNLLFVNLCVTKLLIINLYQLIVNLFNLKTHFNFRYNAPPHLYPTITTQPSSLLKKQIRYAQLALSAPSNSPSRTNSTFSANPGCIDKVDFTSQACGVWRWEGYVDVATTKVNYDECEAR